VAGNRWYGAWAFCWRPGWPWAPADCGGT